MDAGLARFAVLVVLFFLMTGDLAGMVRHLFEESAGGYGGGKTPAAAATAVDANAATRTADKRDGAGTDGADAEEAFGKVAYTCVRDDAGFYLFVANFPVSRPRFDRFSQLFSVRFVRFKTFSDVSTFYDYHNVST